MTHEFRRGPNSRYSSPGRNQGKRKPHKVLTEMGREREDLLFLIGAYLDKQAFNIRRSQQGGEDCGSGL